MPTSAYEFANGEIYVRYEESVRGSDAFVVQSVTTPVNTWIMETLLMVDALKRASAKRITVVSPFYPYARQDRKAMGREPITAKLLANMVPAAVAKRKRTGGTSPKTRAELYEEAKRRKTQKAVLERKAPPAAAQPTNALAELTAEGTLRTQIQAGEHDLEIIAIREHPPSAADLRRMLGCVGGDLRRALPLLRHRFGDLRHPASHPGEVRAAARRAPRGAGGGAVSPEQAPSPGCGIKGRPGNEPSGAA